MCPASGSMPLRAYKSADDQTCACDKVPRTGCLLLCLPSWSAPQEESTLPAATSWYPPYPAAARPPVLQTMAQQDSGQPSFPSVPFHGQRLQLSPLGISPREQPTEQQLRELEQQQLLQQQQAGLTNAASRADYGGTTRWVSPAEWAQPSRPALPPAPQLQQQPSLHQWGSAGLTWSSHPASIATAPPRLAAAGSLDGPLGGRAPSLGLRGISQGAPASCTAHAPAGPLSFDFQAQPAECVLLRSQSPPPALDGRGLGAAQQQARQAQLAQQAGQQQAQQAQQMEQQREQLCRQPQCAPQQLGEQQQPGESASLGCGRGVMACRLGSLAQLALSEPSPASQVMLGLLQAGKPQASLGPLQAGKKDLAVAGRAMLARWQG